MKVNTEGDLGDACYLLGVVQSIPSGPHQLLFGKSHVTKIRTDEDLKRLYDVVAPLASIQPYISECRIMHDGEAVDWISGSFRGTGRWCPETTLLGAHAYNLQTAKGISIPDAGNQRWLHNITPSPQSTDRIIVNRTGRYRNTLFPWQQIVNHYGDRLLFVGSPHEYRDFCGEWGCIEYIKTSNMLEVAELIYGSALFIGNQSSPNAVAEGLKHSIIQETNLQIPDCIFRRPNAQHVSDGKCTLPDVDGSGIMEIPYCNKDRKIFRTHRSPPNGWRYGSLHQTDWNALIVSARRLQEFRGMPESEIATAVMEENWNRVPDFFRDDSFPHLFHTFNQAYQNASVV